MYQVTVIWEGAEIGYGEGESESFAKSEAIESVESIYASARTDWKFSVIRPKSAKYRPSAAERESSERQSDMISMFRGEV